MDLAQQIYIMKEIQRIYSITQDFPSESDTICS